MTQRRIFIKELLLAALPPRIIHRLSATADVEDCDAIVAGGGLGSVLRLHDVAVLLAASAVRGRRPVRPNSLKLGPEGDAGRQQVARLDLRPSGPLLSPSVLVAVRKASHFHV